MDSGADITLHERTVVDILKAHSRAAVVARLPRTGAHDMVFNTVPKVTLYWAGGTSSSKPAPEQAPTWRTVTGAVAC
jgi:hypothetical protein